MIKRTELVKRNGVFIRKILGLFKLLHGLFLWYKRERAFRSFLNNIKDHSINSTSSDEILVVIQPWHLTPFPWYLIVLAIKFHFYGKTVCIVWDDTGFGIDKWYVRLEQKSIHHVIERIPKYIKCIRLSQCSKSENNMPSSFQVEHLVRKNKTIRYRGEFYPNKSEQFTMEAEKTLKNTACHIHSLLDNLRPSYIIIAGGGYGASGIWIDLAKAMNIRVASIDAGFSILVLSTDGIAANLDDIPRAFKLLLKEDDFWIIAEAQAELKRRMLGEDQSALQTVKSTGGLSNFGVLLPLNLSNDLSALERHRVFKNQTEWMLETVEWVLNNSFEKIVIRRHPVERFPKFASNDDYLKCIKSKFGNNERIRFVDSKTAINTYDLIEKAKVVVPYVSTVGIEAAALGKIVVTEGDSCYANLGFVWGAQNREEYFEFLNKAINGELKITEKQQADAWRCYYLTQCCNWHHTIFTPQPSDFDKWVVENPEVLLAKEEVLVILDAIEKNVPLAILLHNKKKKSRATEVKNAKRPNIS